MYALADSILETFRDFRSDCIEWEDEVRSLFEEVDRFLAKSGRKDIAASEVSIAQDVAGLKGLVEQQTEVLTALVNALTEPGAIVSRDESDARATHETTADIDPFERLQHAIAAAAD